MVYLVAALGGILFVCLFLLVYLLTRYKVGQSFGDIRTLAYSFRAPSCGLCRPHTPYRSLMLSAKRLARDRKEGRTLFEFEKWLYDNFYLIRQCMTAVRKVKWRKLPYSNGTPRVLTLAEFLVEHVEIGRESIKDAVFAVQEITPLGWQELTALPVALRMALLGQLMDMMDRSNHFRKMYQAAKGETLADLMDDDCYLYYHFAEDVPTVYRSKVDTARRQFFLTLVELEQRTKRYVEALRLAGAEMPYEYLLTLSTSLPLLDRHSLEHVSNETKLAYLGRVSAIAHRCNLQESVIVAAVNNLAHVTGEDIAVVLTRPSAVCRYVRRGKIPKLRERKAKQYLFIAACTFVSLGLAVLPLIFLPSALTAVGSVLLLVPLVPTVEQLFKSLYRPKTMDLCMDYREVPDCAKTIVVVSRYVDSVESFAKADKDLVALSFNSPPSNITYCLLMDFAPSDTEWSDADANLLAEIRKTAERNPRLLYAVRGRVKDGNKYVAWERKRGAVLQLFGAIMREENPFVYCSRPLEDYRFAILLDDDSKLLPGGVLDAVNCILHPAASRYDIMSFDTSVNKYSLTTRYSLRFAQQGQTVGYPSSGDFYYGAFGLGLYCGKAIVRVANFYRGVRHAFPTRRILSHDLIEGAYLRTGSLHRVLYEDAPSTFAADVKRTSRWQRGDLLLLPYLGGRVLNDQGIKYRPLIKPIYRWIIALGGLNVIKDLCLLLTIFLGCLGNYYLAIAGLGVLFAPYGMHLIMLIFRGGYNLKYGLIEIGQILWRMLERLLLLPFHAFSGLTNALSTLFRSMAGKNMLTWQPFFLTQKGGGFWRYARSFVPSKILMTLLAVAGMNIPFAIYSGLFVLYALVVYNDRPVRKPTLDGEYLRQMDRFARDTLSYFDRYEGLIPDNLQLDPVPTSPDMTSPTDLGFALLAEVCAISLGHDPMQRMARIKSLLQIIERLPRWMGHLYNWYSMDGKPLTDAVSSVDSANFCIAIRIVKQACLRYGQIDAIKACNRLLAADFGKLFDWDRNMLYISYHVKSKRGEGVYDTLMSEARLAYLLAVAQGVPVQAYMRLSRDVGKGNVLLSWGGTAFEYLMPTLFVRAPLLSLVRQAERGASKRQTKTTLDGVWGKSESCYYALGDDLRYRYRSNGVPALALSPEVGRAVVSPYASALTMPYIPNQAARNLLALSLTTYDQYGFCEGVERGHVIPVHMAHHQGMLLCALTNLLDDDVLCRYLADDPEIVGTFMLLQEGRSTAKVGGMVRHHAMPSPRVRSFVYTKEHLAAHILINKQAKGIFLSDGRQEIYVGDTLLGGLTVGLWGRPDGRIWVKDMTDRSVFSPYGSLSNDHCVFEMRADEVRYLNVDRHVQDNVRLLPAGDGVLHDVVIDNPSDRDRQYQVALHQSLSLTTKGAILSHRCYQDLFVVTAPVEDDVFAYRQTTEGSVNRTLIGSVGLTDILVNSTRRNVMERGGEVDEIVFERMAHPVKAPFGNVLFPCATIVGTVEVKAGESKHIYWYITRTDDPARTAETWRNHYRNKIYHYLGMANTEPQVDLFNKYATKEVGYWIASALLNHKQLSTTGDKQALPQSGKWERDLATALCARLLSAVGDFVLAPPSVMDYKAKVLVDIAGQSEKAPLCDLTPRRWDVWPRLASCAKPERRVDYPAGQGGFAGVNYYVTGTPQVPYTNVVSNGKAGFVLSDNGGGWLFGANARQDKYTPWASDPVGDPPCHRLWAFAGDKVYRLNGLDSLCVHGPSTTTFISLIEGAEVKTTYSIAGEQILITVQSKIPIRVLVAVDIPLDWTTDGKPYIKRVSSHQAVVAHPDGKRAALFVTSGRFVTNDETLKALLNGQEPKDKRFDYLGCLSDPASEVTFALGGKADRGHQLAIPFGCSLPSVEYLLGGLWRQIVHSRLNARAGYYQCGGAYGYRDQLQDLTAYMYGDLDKVRDYLLLFASHQYLAGDVMHWWHPPRTGVRTRITDDRLFLVTTAVKYIRMSGDVKLLREEVAYLTSDPLALGEMSRYETSSITRPYPFAHHLYMAITSVLRYGSHGLLLVGGGDWNDGMDKVGAMGKGESVWLSMFAYRTIKDSLDLFDKEQQALLIKESAKIQKGIEGAFVKDRFVAFFDDQGRAIGDGTGNCALYLLTQAWAVLSGAVEPSMAEMAMATAAQLVDYEHGVVKLFDPPFDASDKVGYIAAYPKGIRENGAQYTHGAMWYLLALIESGQIEFAYELFCMLNPLSSDKKAEPYVLSADIYTHPDHLDQAGWSWYTGSAAWMLRVIVEGFYGLTVRDRCLYIKPRLPKALEGSTLVWTFEGTTYHIRCTPSSKAQIKVGGTVYGQGFALVKGQGDVMVECHYKSSK